MDGPVAVAARDLQRMELETLRAGVCPVPVRKIIPMAAYLELVGLFFIQGAALGMWFVPLSGVLDAHGLHSIRPYAFAASALAAFVSPLIFGAMADRHASPVLVLRGLALATAVAMALTSTAIKLHANVWIVLACIQLHALCSSPTWSLSSAIVFARVADAQKDFGPIRAMATLGWMAGCWIISLLNADTSTLAGYSGALAWLFVSALTFFLPVTAPKPAARLAWTERLGLDALTLWRNRDHRVVFITTILFSIPLGAFYPYAPLHLRQLGLQHTSAWMSLAQIPEMIAMFGLGALLLRWRFKWVLAAGLAFGVARFAASALDSRAGLLIGVSLHGASFTLVFITAQIYLDQRVDSSWRARAQALLSVLNGGVGNLLGYLGTGAWFSLCTRPGGTEWPLFWGALAAVVAIVLIYFLAAYRGKQAPPPAQAAGPS